MGSIAEEFYSRNLKEKALEYQAITKNYAFGVSVRIGSNQNGSRYDKGHIDAQSGINIRTASDKVGMMLNILGPTTEYLIARGFKTNVYNEVALEVKQAIESARIIEDILEAKHTFESSRISEDVYLLKEQNLLNIHKKLNKLRRKVWPSTENFKKCKFKPAPENSTLYFKYGSFSGLKHRRSISPKPKVFVRFSPNLN